MTPTVRVLSTGGTIAGVAGADGVAPSKGGRELVGSISELEEHARIEVEQVVQKSSSDMALDDVGRVAERTLAAAEAGVDGVVITHGTDTMEESAYYLDLVLALPIPVAFTGAMRHFDAVSSDGPANLLASVRAVAHPRLAEMGGVYVVANDEVHAARDVTKTHTSKLETFASPGKGPVATLYHDRIAFHRDRGGERGIFAPSTPTGTVEMVKSAVGVDGRQIDRAIDDGVDGIVVEGTGLGHTTRALAERVGEATDEAIPVVLTSRCPAGEVGGTYEIDRILRRNGAILAGDLPAHKARIKLLLALEHAEDLDSIRAVFEGEPS